MLSLKFHVAATGESKPLSVAPSSTVKEAIAALKLGRSVVVAHGGVICDESQPLSAYAFVTDGTTLDVLPHLSRQPLGVQVGQEFNAAYHFDFRSIDDGTQTHSRGGRRYVRPCGCYRIAINVKEGAGTTPAWLQLGDDAWLCAFFGTSKHATTKKTMAKTAFDATVASEQAFEGTWFVGVEDPKVALEFAPPFHWRGHRLRAVLQARCNPASIQDIRGAAGWMAFEHSTDMRPYAICVYGLPTSVPKAQINVDELGVAALQSMTHEALFHHADAYKAVVHLADRQWLSAAACHDSLVKGGPLYPSPEVADDDNVTVEVPWVTGLLVPEGRVNKALGDEATYNHDEDRNVVTVSGPRGVVANLVQMLKDEKESCARATWTSASMAYALVALDASTSEFADVRARFGESMDASRIRRIERIENRALLRRYLATEAGVRAAMPVGQRGTASRMLWHGTRLVDPKRIYIGNDGFKRNFSEGGYWGRATYFAERAAYSDGFAYVSGAPVGEKQMILATVATGTFETLAADRGIKIPSERTDKPDRRYDSISGTTASTTVFMIYIDDAAYPEYLITYQ